MFPALLMKSGISYFKPSIFCVKNSLKPSRSFHVNSGKILRNDVMGSRSNGGIVCMERLRILMDRRPTVFPYINYYHSSGSKSLLSAPENSVSASTSSSNSHHQEPTRNCNIVPVQYISERFISRSARRNLASEKEEKDNDDEKEKPKGLVQRFKDLWKRYWYIVLPVHAVTSCIWLGGFYYASYSGLDVLGILETLHFMPETWLDKLKQAPQAGHIAVAYALYKLFSPARYAVTIGGTHVSMRILSNLGLIPTYKEVRSDVSDYIKEKRHAYRIRRDDRREARRKRFQRFRLRFKKNGKFHHPFHSKKNR